MPKKILSVDYAALKIQMHELIIRGLHVHAKNILETLNVRDIPRNLAFEFADLAWRAGNSLFALKLLYPIVFPKNNFSAAASDAEKMIYASALMNLGAGHKALEIFEMVNVEKTPDVLLRKAMANFSFWEYQKSVSLLNEFIKRPDISEYKRLIGKLNLAAAHIFLMEFELAASNLDSLIIECEKNSYELLLGNCLELSAQIKIFKADYPAARPLLEKAQTLLKDQQGHFSLYVEKWQVICNCLEMRTPESFVKLKALKMKAEETMQWETIRECDLFEAIASQNEDLAKKVIVGTPFENYRQRARNLFGKKLVPQGKYHLRLHSENCADPASQFNPYEVLPSGQALFEKPQLLALYEALALDFYKPSDLGLLFQKIYPGEKFNPFNSPDRVLQLLRRLDQWLEENKVDLKVRMKKSEFTLAAADGKNIEILVWRAKKLSKQDAYHQQLREIFKNRTFSTQQVAEKMNVSRRLANKIIGEELEAKNLVQVGTGRATLYQLNSKQRTVAA